MTADCNLRCRYCYQNVKQARQMSWRTARRAIDILVASDQPELKVLFVGGEPLLHFGLVRRSVARLRSGLRKGQTLRLAITTNGTLIDSRAAAFLARHDFTLDLSFDGIPEAQQVRGPRTFGRLDHLLDHLRRAHPRFFQSRVRVNVNLVPPTIRYLSRSIDYLLDKGVADIQVAPAMTGHDDWRSERIEELEAEMGRVYSRALAHRQGTARIPLHFLRAGPGSRPSAWLCGAWSGESLAVDVDGEAFGCGVFARSYQRFPKTRLGDAMGRLALGHITSPAIGARLEAYESVMRETGVFDRRDAKYSSYGRCATCECRSTCTVCPVAIVRQPGNNDPHRIPDFGCAFSRVASRYARMFHEGRWDTSPA